MVAGFIHTVHDMGGMRGLRFKDATGNIISPDHKSELGVPASRWERTMRICRHTNLKSRRAENLIR
jgi:hypothetical protein